ncbi:YadA-like family protein, partial [Morganella morganii]
TNTTFSAGMGVGNYRNGNAIAAGAQYKISDNVNVRTSVSWNNEDSAVVGGGIAVGW